MRTKDIQAGEFYRASITGRDDDLVKVIDPSAPERWPGDSRRVLAQRALVKGIIEVRLSARDILFRHAPTARTLRVWDVIENG